MNFQNVVKKRYGGDAVKVMNLKEQYIVDM